MALTQISVDVYCQRNADSNPIYRVYVDNDLLTERTWAWPAYEIYIKENIEVDIEPGQHRVMIYTCNGPGNVIFKNLTVNGVTIPETVHNEFQETAFVVNP